MGNFLKYYVKARCRQNFEKKTNFIGKVYLKVRREKKVFRGGFQKHMKARSRRNFLKNSM